MDTKVLMLFTYVTTVRVCGNGRSALYPWFSVTHRSKACPPDGGRLELWVIWCHVAMIIETYSGIFFPGSNIYGKYIK